MQEPSINPSTTANSARRHLVYLYLLQECLTLSEPHISELKRHYHLSREDADEMLIRPYPAESSKVVLIPEVAKMFDNDLQGVPGFYYGHGLNQYDALAHLVGLPPLCEPEYAWRINLLKQDIFVAQYKPPATKGYLKPYLDERGRIQGIFIYRSIKDQNPSLLSSRGLCLGTPAIHPDSSVQRSIAA